MCGVKRTQVRGSSVCLTHLSVFVFCVLHITTLKVVLGVGSFMEYWWKYTLGELPIPELHGTWWGCSAYTSCTLFLSALSYSQSPWSNSEGHDSLYTSILYEVFHTEYGVLTTKYRVQNIPAVRTKTNIYGTNCKGK